MPITFESLPRELRDQIYKECLITDKEIVPFPCKPERQLWDHGDGFHIWIPRIHLDAEESHKTLALGLLRVNHLIGNEAAELYYSANTFRLSRYDADHIKVLWLRYNHLFRHLVLGDEPGDLPKRGGLIDRFFRRQKYVIADADRQTSTPVNDIQIFEGDIKPVDVLYDFRKSYTIHYREPMAERFNIVRKMLLETLELGVSMNTCTRVGSCTECIRAIIALGQRCLDQFGAKHVNDHYRDYPPYTMTKISRLAISKELYGNSQTSSLVNQIY